MRKSRTAKKKLLPKIGTGAFIAGIIIAILGVAFNIPFMKLVLILSGVIVGLFRVKHEQAGMFLMASLLFYLGVWVKELWIEPINFVISILSNLILVIIPAAITVAFKTLCRIVCKDNSD